MTLSFNVFANNNDSHPVSPSSDGIDSFKDSVISEHAKEMGTQLLQFYVVQI